MIVTKTIVIKTKLLRKKRKKKRNCFSTTAPSKNSTIVAIRSSQKDYF